MRGELVHIVSESLSELYNSASPELPDRLSKSKLKSFKTCERKYYYKYVLGLPDKMNKEVKKRGTVVHQTIEQYYENITTYISNTGEFPTPVASFLPPKDSWRNYTHPYLTSFIAFEMERLEEADTPEEFMPHSIEAWNKVVLQLGRPWVGYADVILRPESVPDISSHLDAFILDFKTGESGPEQYRDTGVYLDGQYYTLLFNDMYDSVSSGGLYLKDDTFVEAPTSSEELSELVGSAYQLASNTVESEFSADTGPLCCWGSEEGERCPYYEVCKSNWAAPIDNSEKFSQLLQEDKDEKTIANELGCSVESINYWSEKLPVDLHEK